MTKNHLEAKTKWLARPIRLVILAILASLISACVPHQTTTQPEVLSECHAIFDAGSSGTRLYIYQLSGPDWIQHIGPQVVSLADSMGKTGDQNTHDADSVIQEVVGAMDLILETGPLDKKGKNKWPAFDWHSQCQLKSVAVYATAGMRRAEEKHPTRSKKFWAALNSELAKRFDVAVSTRTISGFEEGLYAWLATGEQESHFTNKMAFGISEMGGGSAQLTFPCESCSASKTVLIHGETMALFSRSYLGLGQDEAWVRHPDKTSCKHAAGVGNERWRAENCEQDITFSEQFEKDAEIVNKQNNIRQWYLTGAFKFSKPDDVDKYCLDDKDSGYQKETSCFRTIYQSRFLKELGVPVNSKLSDADWTLGALLCQRESCLSLAGPPECQWSSGGCL